MIARRPRGLRQHLIVGGFLAPALILLGIFVVAPVAWAVGLSLTDWRLTGPGALHPKFIGLTNYGRLIGSDGFQQAILRTGSSSPSRRSSASSCIGLAAALALHRRDIRLKGLWGAAILMPLVVPETVAAFAWSSMLESSDQGTVNRAIGLAGIAPVAWLQDSAMLAIIVVNIWRGIAFAMILFAAALEGVPQEVTEAATVDGASPRQLLDQDHACR